MSALANDPTAPREYERELSVFGSHARICVGVARSSREAPELAAYGAECRLREIHDSLSRFRPESDLCKLNRRSERTVQVSPLIAEF